jgi:transcriptional regulator of arginine metabolism
MLGSYLDMKTRRQSAILETIRQEPVRSQEQLRRSLHSAGFDVTQATLSRDIRDLGLVKGGPDGAYQAPGRAETNGQQAASKLQRAMAEYLTRVERVQQLVLLRTGPGQAQILGVAIDSATLPGVVGTLAGDDTILVIARDAAHAKALVKRFDAISHA